MTENTSESRDARLPREEEQDVDFEDYPVGDYDRDEIIVLAGKSYIDPLREREAFAAGIDERVSYPLQENASVGSASRWLG